MRAKYIFEKFQEESDPIDDMGIGMMAVIENWLKEQHKAGNLWRIPGMADLPDILRILLKRDADETYIWYILKKIVSNEYDKDDVLDIFDIVDKYKKYIDYLLANGAEFNELLNKLAYIKRLNGTETTLTPHEQLVVAINCGDLDEVKNLIESGVKLTIGMINSVFKHDISWLANSTSPKNFDYRASLEKLKIDKKEIFYYLQSKSDSLEDILLPRDFKKIEKIKTLLNLNVTGKIFKYPQGYKIYRVLDFINNAHPTKKEIIKFVTELTYGKGSFNPLTHSSFWTDGFTTLINPRSDIIDGQYYLNVEGKKRLKTLHDKFKSMNIESHL